MNAEIRHIRSAAEQALLDAFAARRETLPSLAAERADALRMFEQAGLPHRRVEEWKYTDLRSLMREAKPLAGRPDAAALAAAKAVGKLPGVQARRLAIVNGTFVPKLSDVARLEPGLTIMSLADALASGTVPELGHTVPTTDVAVALNTAFMTDGVVIRVAAGAAIERPIQLVFSYAGEAGAVFTRSLVTVGDGAALTLIETHQGPPAVDYQVNHALELVVGDQARVDHVKIGREGEAALHIGSLMARVGKQARLHEFAFTTGSAVTRNQLFVQLAGADTLCGVRGATLVRGRQHIDTTMVIDHAAVGCESREVFKTVLDEESRGVFQGKIIVRPGAQKTDGKMASHALLLSESAEADHKPELEIFADDVQCGHGATAGALDEDLLFYLKARGIPPKQAEALLIQSFVGEAIESVEHEALRDALVGMVEAWLQARQ